MSDVKGADYKHPTHAVNGQSFAELREQFRDALGRGIHVKPYQPVPACAVPEDGLDRVEAWMSWKGRKDLLARLAAQAERATKRGSRGTTVQLADLDRLISGLRVGPAPS